MTYTDNNKIIVIITVHKLINNNIPTLNLLVVLVLLVLVGFFFFGKQGFWRQFFMNQTQPTFFARLFVCLVLGDQLVYTNFTLHDRVSPQ